MKVVLISKEGFQNVIETYMKKRAEIKCGNYNTSTPNAASIHTNKKTDYFEIMRCL